MNSQSHTCTVVGSHGQGLHIGVVHTVLTSPGYPKPLCVELRQCRHHSVNAATGGGVRQCFMVAENALQTVSCEEGHSTHSTFVSVDTSLHLDGR